MEISNKILAAMPFSMALAWCERKFFVLKKHMTAPPRGEQNKQLGQH